MNRFSQLNQDQMLELCNIIKPEGNWKFAQLMNESPIESAESDDNIYEFTTDDDNDIVQFYPHEEDGSEVRCYIDHNGDMENDWIPEEKSESIDLYLKKISPDDTSHSKEEDEIVVGTDINEDSKQESKNKQTKTHHIKAFNNKFVKSKGVDKFTKNEEYTFADTIKLDCSKLDTIADNKAGIASWNSALENSVAKMQRSSFHMYLNFTYRQNSGQDIFFLSIKISQINVSGHEFRIDALKDGEIILLIDDEPNVLKKSLSYSGGTSEEIVLETDMSLLSKIINAKKIEYRIQGANGIFSESSFSKDDILKFIGFYNSIFDTSFKKSEILKSIKPKPEPKAKPKTQPQPEPKATSLNSEPESNKWYNTGYLWLVLVLFWPIGVYGIYRRFF